MMRTIILGIVVFVMVSVGAWYLWQHATPGPALPTLRDTSGVPQGPPMAATSTTYHNARFGYTITYPIALMRREYPNGSIALGVASSSLFQVLANVRVATANTSNQYADFNTFVTADSRNQCAADGPTGSIRCQGTIGLHSYTTSAGQSGVTFSLDRVYDHFATATAKVATTTHDTFGPFYAFNLGTAASVPYVALIVQPSPSLSPGTVNATLLQQLADSLRFSTASSQ